VAIDREDALKKAEKLLKQGKVAGAIEEYVRIVEDRPGDWNSANTLGDLYVKIGQTDHAAEQFTHAADHLYGEGFFPRASAVYKKVLKVRSGDDHALWQLADIAGRNGLSLDARSYYGRLIQDRRASGNERGAVDCLIRLGQLDDASVDARKAAASALVDRGESKPAARLLLAAADALTKASRLDEAFPILQEAARLAPDDREIHDKLEAATPVAAPEPEIIIASEPAIVETQDLAAATSSVIVDLPAEVAPVIEPIEPAPPLDPMDHVADASPEQVDTPPPAMDADDGVIALDQAAMDPAAVLAEIVSLPDPEPESAEPLPLESFFEELRGRVARDEAARARGQSQSEIGKK
jgi:tetratricopeptide (TPR) repeat protein